MSSFSNQIELSSPPESFQSFQPLCSPKNQMIPLKFSAPPPPQAINNDPGPLVLGSRQLRGIKEDPNTGKILEPYVN